MRITIHTGLKITPFELHHGRKPRSELTNLTKDGKPFVNPSRLKVDRTYQSTYSKTAKDRFQTTL